MRTKSEARSQNGDVRTGARTVGLALLAAGLALGQGGPDRGGYRWLDSDTSAGPVFDWVDISAAGLLVELGDDDNAGPFALGFGFDFYGQEFDSVRVCSNGWLSFTSSSHQFHHHPVPDPRDPNALLAALWADLDPSAGGEVRLLADTANARFIVSWLGVPFYGGDTCSFQVVLDTSGTVLFQYLVVPAGFRDGADSCTVGIENGAGLTGLEYLRDGEPAGNRLHDSLAIRFFRLDRDIAVERIGRPFEQELAGMTVEPAVLVRNSGRAAADFPLAVSFDGYADTVQVTGLAALGERVVRFREFEVPVDTFELTACAGLGGDEFPGNDTLRVEVAGSRVGELRFDDGEADTAFLRVGSPNSDWAALARFDTPGQEFRLTGARVFVLGDQPFARLLVCPDSSGAPCLGQPFLAAESVSGAAGSWLEVPADTVLPGGEPAWLVAFWPRGADGPAIGDDRDAPTDSASWFGSPTVRWLPHPAGDLMMRLEVDGRTGVEELEPGRVAGFRLEPNPVARGAAVFRVQGFEGPMVRVRLFDASGRCLFERAFVHRSSSAGLPLDLRGLSSGVYLVRVESASRTASGKLVIR